MPDALEPIGTVALREPSAAAATRLQAEAAPGLAALAEGEVLRVPIIEESLQVDKRLVDRGGFRITKRVETRNQLVDELLRSERVDIERRAINVQIADDAIPPMRQEGDTLIVPVIEEVLVTVKRLVLVEEVRITRVRDTQHVPQTYTLRKEHVEVERLAAEGASATQSPQPPNRQGQANHAPVGISEE